MELACFKHEKCLKNVVVRLINVKYILRKQLIFNLIDFASQGWF